MNPDFVNRLWIKSMQGGYERFISDIKDVEQAQKNYLLALLKKNADCQYGIRYGFGNIKSVSEFQKNIPLTNYEDYAPYIEQIASGGDKILTTEQVLLFEPSSGTTSASKLIPYTKSLQEEFKRGIAIWMVSLYRRKPELYRGTSYWSISPALDHEDKGVIRVGYDEDAEYLGFEGKKFYDHIAAVPSDVGKCKDIDEFRLTTLLYLLASDNLAFVSVWNPTFLTLLCKYFIDNNAMILERLASFQNERFAKRAREIESIISSASEQALFQKIWPGLSVISCWTDGACNPYVSELKSFFPDVEIQGKGLLSTEAFVSLPFEHGCDPVLSVNSHFFEFRAESNGEITLANELEVDKIYSVIVTTGGGLYRYQLGDRIRVTGKINDAPVFMFLSKDNDVSDIFGEKLNQEHVERCFENVFDFLNCKPKFYLLAPVKGNNEVYYTVFIENGPVSKIDYNEFAEKFENLLQENYHYKNCRHIKQLGALRIFEITAEGSDCFMREMLKKGRKLGNVKPACISRDFGWEEIFRGTYVKE